MKKIKAKDLFNNKSKIKPFIEFSVIRAIYGFSVLGLGYLITEILNIDFNIRVVLIPLALLALTIRILKYYKKRKIN